MSYKYLYSLILIFVTVNLFCQSFEFGAEIESAFYTSDERMINSEIVGIEYISDSLGVTYTGTIDLLRTITYSNEASPILTIGRNFKLSERDYLKLSVGFRAMNVKRNSRVELINASDRIYGDTISIVRPEFQTECDTFFDSRDFRDIVSITVNPSNNPIEYRTDKFNFSANYMRQLKNEILEISVGGFFEYATSRRRSNRDLEILNFGEIDSMGTIGCSTLERFYYSDSENLSSVNLGLSAGLWINVLPRLTTKFGLRKSFMNVFNSGITEHSYSPTHFSVGLYLRKYDGDSWFKGLFKKRTE